MYECIYKYMYVYDDKCIEGKAGNGTKKWMMNIWLEFYDSIEQFLWMFLYNLFRGIHMKCSEKPLELQ